MQHPLGAESALNREIGGLSRKPEEIANQVWLRGIRNTRSLLFYDEVPSQRQIGIRFGIPPSEDDFRITAMVRDESTASILTGACGTHDADNNVVVSVENDVLIFCGRKADIKQNTALGLLIVVTGTSSSTLPVAKHAWHTKGPRLGVPIFFSEDQFQI